MTTRKLSSKLAIVTGGVSGIVADLNAARCEAVDAKLGAREGLQPGDVKKRVTAAVPAGRFGHPFEQSAMAAFLAGPDATYIVTRCYNVDGGNVMS